MNAFTDAESHDDGRLPTCSLAGVQEVLGHSQMAITAEVYSHVLPELRRDAGDRIGGVFFGS